MCDQRACLVASASGGEGGGASALGIWEPNPGPVEGLLGVTAPHMELYLMSRVASSCSAYYQCHTGTSIHCHFFKAQDRGEYAAGLSFSPPGAFGGRGATRHLSHLPTGSAAVVSSQHPASKTERFV